MKRFYVASSFKNTRAVQETIRKLETIGHENTYDWTAAGSSQMTTEEALKSLHGVLNADYIVGLFDSSDFIYKGSIAEFGMAAVLKIPFYVIGDQLDNMVFIHLPNVYRVGSIREVISRENPVPLPDFTPPNESKE